MKSEQLCDTDGCSIRLERAILWQKPCGDGASGKMGNRTASKAAATEVGVGDDGNVGNGAAPNLVTRQGNDSVADEDGGAWMLDGTATMLPLGRVARLLQGIQGSRIAGAERTRRMRWLSDRRCVTDIGRANDCR